MKIETKFSQGDTAYVLTDSNTISKIKIKSIEVKLEKSTDIKYVSESNKEFSEKELFNKREIIEQL